MASSQGIRLLVVVIVVVVVLSSSSSAVAAPPPTKADWEKLGCTDSCGNVSIPYPFGLNDKCYLNPDFLITCNHSQGQQPYLSTSTIPVKNISLEEGELRIMMPISRDCYDPLGAPLPNNTPAGIYTAKYSISNTKNKFTAIGCDTYGNVLISKNRIFIATGCQSQCRSIDYVSNGTCAGNGCCQTSIPKGVGKIDIYANSFNNHRNVSDFNPCSYAFVVEEGAFNFSTTYLRNFTEEMLPMVLDWAIGFNTTCEEAKRNQTNYACGQNTDCHNAENVRGYLCKCLDGYEGKPYFSDGCQDINECENPHQKVCVDGSECINTIGNYTCSCPKRYHGDGRPNGTRCIADKSLLIQIVAGFAIGAMVVLVSSSWLYWIFKKRKLIKLKEKFFRENGGLMLQQRLSSLERSAQEVAKIFSLEELKRATNNYDESRIVGRGGFGIVYKGFLADNRTVAIKKSQMVDKTQIEQFINEVVVLSQINHRNVVKLLGCCLENQVPLLVYEFITNGTLSEHIHNQSPTSTMSWETRLRIAAETAEVLSYLHSAASVPIIHRDVKSTNILLDDNYTAKVADFGASRLVAVDQNQLATVVQGTLGYLDPEYLRTSQLTEKSDVYSFGVVLAELITGKKALSFDRPEEEKCLAMYFLSSMKNDRLFQVIDENIINEENIEELKEVAILAKRCLNLKGEERPTMTEVALELKGSIIKKKEKHPWVNIDLNSEETEHLLHESSSGYEFGGHSSNTTTVGYDSVREHTLLPLDGGR